MVPLIIPEAIETDRLILHRLRYEDAEEIFYCYASKPEATKYVSWPTHITLSDTRTFLNQVISAWNRNEDYSFGIRLKSDNRFIGSIGMIHNNGNIQFGYILGPVYCGRGYATEACKTIMNLLQTLPVFRIWTFVDAENHASVKVLQKSGLIQEALLAKWFRFINQDNELKDCYLFSLPRNPQLTVDILQ